MKLLAVFTGMGNSKGRSTGFCCTRSSEGSFAKLNIEFVESDKKVGNKIRGNR